MNYCGMDIASVSSYLYVTDGSGKKLWGGFVDTKGEALRRGLRPYLEGGLSVAIEAGNQTAWIHELLVGMGADVNVVNPNKVKQIAETKRKTDKVDAKVLCELLRLGGLPRPVHMPGRETRALRALLMARRKLVSARTKLSNTVRGVLRQEGVTLERGALSSKAGWERLLGQGFEHGYLLEIVVAFYGSFLALTKSIKELDSQLRDREQEDDRVWRLETMPKVGKIAALTFVSAVDDVRRFPSSRKLVGYSGLAPTVRSSGERTEYGPITREGRRELRAVWVQIAHLVARDRGRETRPLRAWFDKVARRRGKKTAIVGLARRLLTIAYHILREEAVYDASRFKRRAA